MTNNKQQETPPPLFKTWNRMYLFVLLNLAITIFIFWLITANFK